MKDFNFSTESEVLNFLKKEKDIKFVRLIFPDVLGREMSFCIPSEELKSAFARGKGFDGSSVEGFARIEESDLIIVPEAKTFRVLPWDYEINGLTWKEAVVFGDIMTPRGKHFEGDSRYLLKKTLEKTKKFGSLFVGPELEFFIFGNKNEPQLLDHGGYFYGGKWGEIRKASQLYLKTMGINCECDHHEVASSQHEIDISFADALTTADSIILAKYVIKKVARTLDLFASFMPKPVTALCGNGMHLHMSLWKEKRNLFFEKKPDCLSDLAKKYIMGLIKYGQEIQLGLNQWVNSYKRLIPGYEAPLYLAWGRRNRSAYVRVPEYQPGKEKAVRVELRSPDPACNVYLALSLIQAAGVKGIQENLKFLSPTEEDIFKMSRREIKKRKIKFLSKNLGEALKLFRKSKLTRNTLGDHLFYKTIQNKEIEYSNYQKAVGKKFQKKVSSYEIENYLPVL